MKLGICCSAEDAQNAADAGFDYVELPANSLQSIGRVYLPVEATNLFFPGGISLFGANPLNWRGYALPTVEAAAKLGVKVMVIGSGVQRRSADGQSIPDAEKAFVDIVAGVQEIAQPHGIVIAPEALNRSETDVFNVSSRLASSLQQRNCAYTFDTYHVLLEPSNEDFDLVPVHVHFAGIGRNVPLEGDPVWESCIGPLMKRGYKGRFSLESPAASFGAELAGIQASLRDRLESCRTNT